MDVVKLGGSDIVPPIVSIERIWGGKPISRGMVIFTAIFGSVFMLVALGWLMMAAQGIEESNNVVRLGSLGMIVLAVGAAALFSSTLISAVPRLAEKLAPPVTVRNDPEWGTGVHLNQGSNAGPLELVLAGCTLYGFAAWWAWHSGYGDRLLPLSRDDSGGATIALIFSIVTFSALLLIVFARFSRISVEMYPAGIVCRTPMRGRFRVEWSGISEIRADTCKLSAQYSDAPVVRAILTDSSVPVKHKIFDRVGELGIPACILRCDSDLLLALTKHLLENSDSRCALASNAAEEWFTVRYHQPSIELRKG